MGEKPNRQVLLARRPRGALVAEDFEVVDGVTAAPGPGQVLLQTLYLSIDPAIRGWLDDRASYIEPIEVGGVIRSGSLGRVIESRSSNYAAGDLVVGMSGWELYSVVDEASLGRKLDPDSPLPLSAAMSVLGGTGLTAYFGLLGVGRPQAGETVVVSAAAGAVGSIVGQLAKIHGCRAVGIAGSADKCAWLVDELGFDAAIDRKSEDVGARLKQTCPRGIDVYFDNVGGEILDAALARIGTGGRVVLCGAMSQMNSSEPPRGPANYIRLLTKRARMEGFVLLDHAERWQAGSAALESWVLDGKLKYREEIVEGLDSAPDALLRLLRGGHRGKLMVKT